ncbi:MAG: hypothetical protein HW421_1011 [Ignavibacteria bacterium]|nr:hypothetical protein [Ignavibacteria bacterium]
MKNSSKKIANEDDMRAEYDFADSKPNKYAAILKRQERQITLEPDVFKVFNTSEQVNNVLRAFINAIPKARRRTARTV